MKAVIIDDESHARQSISTLVEFQFKQIQIIGEAANVKDAVNLIKQEKPDLVFLDIDLPDGTGFDILKQTNYKNLKVIFVTAYHNFAIQAIKYSAFDYILKPLNPKELITAVNNALVENEKAEGYQEKFQAFFNNYSTTKTEQKKLVLKTADKIHVVEINNIIHCESDNAYCTIYLNNGNKIIVSKSLKTYEEMLVPLGFMRVHQSHLINCNYISYYDKQDGGTLVMTDNSNIPVSIQKKPVLTAYLDSL